MLHRQSPRTTGTVNITIALKTLQDLCRHRSLTFYSPDGGHLGFRCWKLALHSKNHTMGTATTSDATMTRPSQHSLATTYDNAQRSARQDNQPPPPGSRGRLLLLAKLLVSTASELPTSLSVSFQATQACPASQSASNLFRIAGRNATAPEPEEKSSNLLPV